MRRQAIVGIEFAMERQPDECRLAGAGGAQGVPDHRLGRTAGRREAEQRGNGLGFHRIVERRAGTVKVDVRHFVWAQ